MLTQRAILTAIHGMCFGGFTLLTVFGLFVGAWTTMSAGAGRERLASPPSLSEKVYLAATILLGWAAVLSGTFLVYPWYRAKPPSAGGDLHAFPRALLLSSSLTAPWHSLGMEWKEHVAFLAPITITAVAAIWWRYRDQIAGTRRLRGAVLAFGFVGMSATGVALLLGALLNKLAPIY